MVDLGQEKSSDVQLLSRTPRIFITFSLYVHKRSEPGKTIQTIVPWLINVPSRTA